MLLYNFYSRNFLIHNTLTAMVFFFVLRTNGIATISRSIFQEIGGKTIYVEFHRNWKISNLLNI